MFIGVDVITLFYKAPNSAVSVSMGHETYLSLFSELNK